MTYCGSILELKRKAIAMSLCGNYKDKWDNAKSDIDLIMLASDMNGADFICSGVTKGWGLDKDFICARFGNFTNGRIIRHKGYCSRIYNGYDGNVECDVTILIILYSKCRVVVPENMYCHIYVAGDYSNVHIENHGNVTLHTYSGNVNVERIGENAIVTKSDIIDGGNSWMNF